MLKHFLRTAWRYRLHRRGRTVLDVISVTIGIGCCLVIASYIFEDRRQDLANTERVLIHRPELYDGAVGKLNNANSIWKCGPSLRKHLSEIEQKRDATI